MRVAKHKIMSNTLTIEIPEGFAIDTLDELTGKVTLKPKPKEVTDRLNTFNDVLEYHNLTQKEFKKQTKSLTPDEIGYRKEKLIVAAYNENAIADFSDGKSKYYPIFKMGSRSGVGFSFNDFGHWFTGSAVGARQVFCGVNAKRNMIDAVKKFLPEYKQSRTS